MIEIIAGKNGAGKTYSGVRWIMQQMKKGRLVFSDTPIFFEHKGKLLKTAILTKDMFRNFRFPENCVLFVNEGDSWFNSRAFKDFTAEDLIMFSQSRHLSMDLIIVAKRFGGLDLNIRACCDNFVWSTRFPKSDKIRPFFFKHTVYDAEEDFNAVVPKVKPFVMYYLFRKKVADCYDTKYQRNILAKRPISEYHYWPDSHYVPHRSFFRHLVENFKKKPINL